MAEIDILGQKKCQSVSQTDICTMLLS